MEALPFGVVPQGWGSPCGSWSPHSSKERTSMPVIYLLLVSHHAGHLVPGCLCPSTLFNMAFFFFLNVIAFGRIHSASVQVVFSVRCTTWSHCLSVSVGGGEPRSFLLCHLPVSSSCGVFFFNVSVGRGWKPWTELPSLLTCRCP